MRLGKHCRDDLRLRAARTVIFAPDHAVKQPLHIKALQDRARQRRGLPGCDRDLLRLHAVQLRERIEQRRADKLAQARRVRLADAEALERILHAAQDTLAGVKQRAVKIK